MTGSPRLVVVSGLPGTGKSTLADALGAALGAPVLSVDPIEAAIVRAGISPSFETGLAAYVVAEALADRHLAAGLSAIIDAVSGVEPARAMWRGLAARHNLPLSVIVCVVPDRAVADARLAGRFRGADIAEPSAEDVAARIAEWTDWAEPHLRLDTTARPAALLEAALGWLASRTG